MEKSKSKRATSNNAKLAALEVSNLIGSIVNGPRFQRHLDGYATSYNLNKEERSMLIKRAMRKFLGY